MERYHHISLSLLRGIADVPNLKSETFVAVSFRSCIAVSDNVCFQVETQHFRFNAEYLCKVMVQHKGQIRLSAAEIYDFQRLAAFLKTTFFQSVADNFRKTVYLAELSVHRLCNPAVLGKDAHIHQRGKRLVLGDNIIFHLVMGQLCFRCRALQTFFTKRNSTFFGHHKIVFKRVSP